jgi:phosphotransferase system HPr (HPr) family protein
MTQAEIEIRNPSGLHARPAATFVRAAGAFASDVRVTNLTRDPANSASAKSVIGVMGLGVARGHRVRLDADGADAEHAVASLVELIAGGLGEELDDA